MISVVTVISVVDTVTLMVLHEGLEHDLHGVHGDCICYGSWLVIEWIDVFLVF